MRGFISDWWWAIGCGVLMVLLFVYRLRTRSRFEVPKDARSFGAVHVFRPDDLAAYFGRYAPRFMELAVFIFFVLWFGIVIGLVVWDSGGTRMAIMLSLAVAVFTGILAVFVDARSVRVIGPDRIAFESPLPMFSWSVPISQITQCDLVPGRPHARLRVHSRSGSFSLPLTNELWKLLSRRAV